MGFNLNRLRAERVAKGYNQLDFAHKLGMSREAYARRENGLAQISVEEFSKILDALGYGPEKISLFFTNKRSQKKTKAS